MKTIYKGDTRYEKVYEQMQMLGIQDVSTPRQVKNGTIEWLLPVKDQYGAAIHVASYKTGYVRRTKAGGYCPSWQINKRVESEIKHYGPFEDGTYREYTTRTCKLIPDETERLDYLISFCLKNYYIGQANKLSSGEFIPKWKHEDLLSAMEAQVEGHDVKELQVIIDGHRYNVI